MDKECTAAVDDEAPERSPVCKQAPGPAPQLPDGQPQPPRYQAYDDSDLEIFEDEQD